MDFNQHTIRSRTDGEWFWVSRTVLDCYAKSIGPLGMAAYCVLASMADQRQECFPSQKRIADLLGYSRASVNKALKALERGGLVLIVKRSPYHCTYRLLSVRCKAEETGVSSPGNRGVTGVDTNKNQITRINNQIVGVKRAGIFGKQKDEEFVPQTREELLAWDLATDLNDALSLSGYLSLAKKYPESLLRRALSEARAEREIRKSRVALFNHLVKKYAQRETDYRCG